MALTKTRRAEMYIERMMELSDSLYKTGHGINAEIKAFNYAKRMHTEMAAEMNIGLLLEVANSPTDDFTDNLINKRRKEISTKWAHRQYRRSREVAKANIDYAEMIAANRQVSVDPVKVEQQVTPPPPPTADVQHKIVTQKIQKPKQSDPGRMDSKTIRKKDKRRARAHKDVNLNNITINSETIKGQEQKQARVEKIKKRLAKRKKYRPYDHKTPHQIKKERVRSGKTFGPSVSPRVQASKEAIRIETIKQEAIDVEKARKEYIKNPRRRFSEDAKGFWEDVKATGKRFNEKTQFVPKAKKLLQNRWFRRGLWAVGSTIAFNLVRDRVARALEPPRAIPEEYERGYDNIKQTLTDFGSPVKLAKAAQKVMVPYYSTVRSGLRTNINTVINHNYALASSKHAIRHMQY